MHIPTAKHVAIEFTWRGLNTFYPPYHNFWINNICVGILSQRFPNFVNHENPFAWWRNPSSTLNIYLLFSTVICFSRHLSKYVWFTKRPLISLLEIYCSFCILSILLFLILRSRWEGLWYPQIDLIWGWRNWDMNIHLYQGSEESAASEIFAR